MKITPSLCSLTTTEIIFGWNAGRDSGPLRCTTSQSPDPSHKHRGSDNPDQRQHHVSHSGVQRASGPEDPPGERDQRVQEAARWRRRQVRPEKIKPTDCRDDECTN